MKAFDHPRGEEIGIEILLETLLDAGTQHLDGHVLLAAVGGLHLRLVHLGDGGRRDGWTELGEERAERGFELRLDDLDRLVLGEGRQPVLQCRQIAREFPADNVVPGREKLAELDIRRAERRQRSGEPCLVA